jgi:hypothetical protein
MPFIGQRSHLSGIRALLHRRGGCTGPMSLGSSLLSEADNFPIWACHCFPLRGLLRKDPPGSLVNDDEDGNLRIFGTLTCERLIFCRWSKIPLSNGVLRPNWCIVLEDFSRIRLCDFHHWIWLKFNTRHGLGTRISLDCQSSWAVKHIT